MFTRVAMMRQMPADLEHLPVSVRAARLDDAEALAEVMNQPRAVWGTMQRPFTTLERRREWLQKALCDPHVTSLVAELEGQLVGNLGLHANGSHPRRKHVASIGMSVHDAFAGRGVGTALMLAAIDVADNWLAIRRLELEVYVDNEPAVRLYRKFGFEVEGTLREYAFREGSYVDAFVMSRLRRGPA